MSHDRSIRKQGFLQGTAILTAGILISKVIGALFKIPLTRLITTEGAGHFAVAYNIYIVLLNVAASGLPIAVSRMISQAGALGNRRQIRRIHHTSLGLFLVIGLISSGATLLFSPQIARWMRDPDAVYAIAALSPAVLFVCVYSAFRGYFQGQQYMSPTAKAQVLEACSKLFIGLAAAILALRAGWSYPKVAGASILGVTVGAVLSCLYFIGQYRSRRVTVGAEDAGQTVTSVGRTVKEILWLAVPITIGATGFQIFNVLGNKVILGQLQDSLHLTLEQATSQLGIYTNAQTLYLLPSAIVQPLAISIVPAITEALSLCNTGECRRKTESAVRITGLIAIPCGVGLSVLSGPIQGLIYGYDAATKAAAAPVLAVLGIASILYCFVLVTNAILQANGKVYFSIYTTLAGGIASLVTTHLLVGNSRLRITGAAIGALAYCLVAVSMNFRAIARLSDHPRLLPQLYKTALAAAAMGAAAGAVFLAVHNTILAIGAAVIVYAALVWGLRVLTWYDCTLLPSGQKIAKLLRIRPEA